MWMNPRLERREASPDGFRAGSYLRRGEAWRRRGIQIVLIGITLFACDAETAAAQAPASRIDTFRIAMPQLGGRERTIRIYLPAGYDGGARRYPVLYLQDGQQLFSPGPYGDWLVDETMDRLVAEGKTRGIIVVGIDNGERRWDEYGAWTNRRMHDWVDPSWSRPIEGGEGAAYVDFLARTLKPEIDRRYRTLPGREHTGIGGSSMGGLIALYAGLARPDVFGRVMAMSPAVWFAEGGGPWLSRNRLLDWIASGTPPRDVRFYVDVGTLERSRERDPDVPDRDGRPLTYPRAYADGAAVAADALRERGVPDANLRLVFDEDAPHHESAWARRLEDAVLWLYR
jgi:predicted alpha/beta superfamily hydrolase